MLTFLRNNPSAKLLVLLALLASLLSFAKFDHCRTTNWADPDSYVHACYSDIPSLFSYRNLDVHQWAFKGGEAAVEYPVLTGVVMWATAFLTPAGPSASRDYFDINIILIALLFVAVVLILWKIRPEYAYLLPFSPAVIASLYINWDLWGILTMMLAIYYFDRGRLMLSSSLIAISIATKFFPVFLFLPIVFILWRRYDIKAVLKFLLNAAGVWLAINLPVILTTPQGWWHFYKLNLDRGSDWGSLWYALNLLGIRIDHLNYITILALLAVLTAVTLLLLELIDVPTLAEVSFILLAATLCVGKVYSPQYILWLAPLGIMALRGRGQLPAFWIWQAGEVVYHLAIWLHLAQVQGTHFGLPSTAYALATLLRIATTLYFIAVLVRKLLREPSAQVQAHRSRLADLLFGTASSYP